MWLGSAQQLAKVRLDDVTVLSSHLRVVNTARKLGVVVDCQLSIRAVSGTATVATYRAAATVTTFPCKVATVTLSSRHCRRGYAATIVAARRDI